MNIMDKINIQQHRSDIPDFNVGDSVKVYTKVFEGDNERVQLFSGIVIAKKGAGISATFTVRRTAYGNSMEKVFPLHSKRIEKVEVERHGKVRRSKLYYLRDKIGKSARIKDQEHI